MSQNIHAQALDSLVLEDIEKKDEILAINLFGQKKSVIAFVDASCAYVDEYANRLSEISRKAKANGFQMVFVNPHMKVLSEANSAKKMLEQASFNGWQGKLIADSEQKLAKYFKVSKLPEIVIVDGTSKKMKIIYKGAIDDNPQDETYASENYILPILEGNDQNSRPVPAMGCHIRKF